VLLKGSVLVCNLVQSFDGVKQVVWLGNLKLRNTLGREIEVSGAEQVGWYLKLHIHSSQIARIVYSQTLSPGSLNAIFQGWCNPYFPKS
jgi:hypothetical protein